MRPDAPADARVVVEKAGSRFAVRWFAAEREDWFDLLESFKGWFPPLARGFDAASKRWLVDAGQEASLRAWCRAFFAPEATTWCGATWGGGQRREWGRAHGQEW